MKSLILFLATFVFGAALALGTRTALHEPYAVPEASTPGASAHLDHGDAPAKPATDAQKESTTNTVCAICGMDVDPAIPSISYGGKRVGFGCAACPPRFAKEPDRYGPFALRNEIAPE